jgi:hypothetical protein
MDRLTDRDDLNQAVVHPQYCGDDISWEDYIGLLIDRLAAYEDAEQEGRVVMLPCKVGDTVYWTSNFGKAIHHGKITALKISGFGIDLEIATPANLLFRCEAETVFLTREEAEAALKEAGKSE